MQDRHAAGRYPHDRQATIQQGKVAQLPARHECGHAPEACLAVVSALHGASRELDHKARPTAVLGQGSPCSGPLLPSGEVMAVAWGIMTPKLAMRSLVTSAFRMGHT